MDIADINKVANRKRMNVDAEKLREKVSRETAKIIKLKVAQDTAYWDLKEKLQQLEGNHERLQQNMVDVQMQHETISGQYQDELRHRPETLNKMTSTRSICDVLEDYCSRLKETLGRCRSDQAELCAAYQRSGEIVQGIQQQGRHEEAETRERIAGLERTSVTDSPLCRACMELEETTTHVLMECPGVATYRAKHLGTPRSLQEVVGNVKGLLDFLQELGWQE